MGKVWYLTLSKFDSMLEKNLGESELEVFPV